MYLAAVDRGTEYLLQTTRTFTTEQISLVDKQFAKRYKCSFLTLLNETQTDLLQFYLEHGCCVHQQNERTGDNLLHNFVSLPFQKILLEKGGDPNKRNHKGQTPLHLAVKHNNRSYYELLLQHGAEDVLDNKERSVHDYVVWYKFTEKEL
jgi:ankyrin repeat protein